MDHLERLLHVARATVTASILNEKRLSRLKTRLPAQRHQDPQQQMQIRAVFDNKHQNPKCTTDSKRQTPDWIGAEQQTSATGNQKRGENGNGHSDTAGASPPTTHHIHQAQNHRSGTLARQWRGVIRIAHSLSHSIIIDLRPLLKDKQKSRLVRAGSSKLLLSPHQTPANTSKSRLKIIKIPPHSQSRRHHLKRVVYSRENKPYPRTPMIDSRISLCS